MNKIEYTIVSAVFFIAVSAVGKAIRDHIAHHGGFHKFGKWWTAEGWNLKYKNEDKAQGEAFPGSTTVFVFITDGWHFFDHVDMLSMLLSVSVAFGFIFNLKISVILLCAFSAFVFKAAIFHVLYNVLKPKSK